MKNLIPYYLFEMAKYDYEKLIHEFLLEIDKELIELFNSFNFIEKVDPRHDIGNLVGSEDEDEDPEVYSPIVSMRLRYKIACKQFGICEILFNIDVEKNKLHFIFSFLGQRIDMVKNFYEIVEHKNRIKDEIKNEIRNAMSIVNGHDREILSIKENIKNNVLLQELKTLLILASKRDISDYDWFVDDNIRLIISQFFLCYFYKIERTDYPSNIYNFTITVQNKRLCIYFNNFDAGITKGFNPYLTYDISVNGFNEMLKNIIEDIKIN